MGLVQLCYRCLHGAAGHSGAAAAAVRPHRPTLRLSKQYCHRHHQHKPHNHQQQLHHNNQQRPLPCFQQQSLHHRQQQQQLLYHQRNHQQQQLLYHQRNHQQQPLRNRCYQQQPQHSLQQQTALCSDSHHRLQLLSSHYLRTDAVHINASNARRIRSSKSSVLAAVRESSSSNNRSSVKSTLLQDVSKSESLRSNGATECYKNLKKCCEKAITQSTPPSVINCSSPLGALRLTFPSRSNPSLLSSQSPQFSIASNLCSTSSSSPLLHSANCRANSTLESTPHGGGLNTTPPILRKITLDDPAIDYAYKLGFQQSDLLDPIINELLRYSPFLSTPNVRGFSEPLSLALFQCSDVASVFKVLEEAVAAPEGITVQGAGVAVAMLTRLAGTDSSSVRLSRESLLPSLDGDCLLQPAMSRLLHVLQQGLRTLDDESIVVLLTQLYSLGISMETVALRNMLIHLLQRIDNLSLDSVSRMMLLLKYPDINFAVKGKFLTRMPYFMNECATLKDFTLITYCMLHCRMLLSEDIIAAHARKTEALLDAGVITSDTPSTLLDVLNVSNDHQQYSQVCTKIFQLLIEHSKPFEQSTLLSLIYYCHNKQQDRRIMARLRDQSARDIRFIKDPVIQARLFMGLDPKEAKKLRDSFESVVRQLLPGDSFQRVYYILRSRLLNNTPLIHQYWNRELSVMESNLKDEISPLSRESTLSRVHQRYFRFNNNLGGTFRHHELEDRLLDYVTHELRGPAGCIIYRFTRMACFVLAYSSPNGIPPWVLHRILDNVHQYNVRRLVQLTSALQKSLALNVRCFSPQFVEQSLAIAHMLNNVTRRLAQKSHSLDSLCHLCWSSSIQDQVLSKFNNFAMNRGRRGSYFNRHHSSNLAAGSSTNLDNSFWLPPSTLSTNTTNSGNPLGNINNTADAPSHSSSLNAASNVSPASVTGTHLSNLHLPFDDLNLPLNQAVTGSHGGRTNGSGSIYGSNLCEGGTPADAGDSEFVPPGSSVTFLSLGGESAATSSSSSLDASTVLGRVQGVSYSQTMLMQVAPYLVPHINQMSPKTATFIARAFKNSNFSNTEVLESLLHYMCRESTHMLGQTVADIVFCIYTCGHQTRLPQPLLRSLSTVMTQDANAVYCVSLLQAALSLCLYQALTRPFIAAIFNVNFLDRLDDDIKKCFSKSTYPQRVRRLLMEVNRSITLDYPEARVPWFHEQYCKDWLQTVCHPPGGFHSEVSSVLSRLLGSERHFSSNSYSPYYYHLDFQFTLDRQGRPVECEDSSPLQPRQTSSCTPVPGGHTRYCLLLLKPNEFVQVQDGSLQLKGSSLLRKRHLEVLGYTVLHLPRHEWQAMALSTQDSKLKYLRSLIWPHHS